MANDEADKIAEIRLDLHDKIKEFIRQRSVGGTVELQAADSLIVQVGARHKLKIRVALDHFTVAAGSAAEGPRLSIEQTMRHVMFYLHPDNNAQPK